MALSLKIMVPYLFNAKQVWTCQYQMLFIRGLRLARTGRTVCQSPGSFFALYPILGRTSRDSIARTGLFVHRPFVLSKGTPSEWQQYWWSDEIGSNLLFSLEHISVVRDLTQRIAAKRQTRGKKKSREQILDIWHADREITSPWRWKRLTSAKFSVHRMCD